MSSAFAKSHSLIWCTFIDSICSLFFGFTNRINFLLEIIVLSFIITAPIEIISSVFVFNPVVSQSKQTYSSL